MKPFDDHPPDALVRAAFCSEANFSSWADPRGVELEISRIMYPAPRTGADHQVGGIFHYCNRYFLQCVEGPASAVEFMFRRTRDDNRHKNCKLLVVEPISERLFPVNTMRHASMRRELLSLFERHGVGEFNPYRLDAGMLAEFVRMYADEHRK